MQEIDAECHSNTFRYNGAKKNLVASVRSILFALPWSPHTPPYTDKRHQITSVMGH